MEYAQLEWNDDGTPQSVSHGDVYFSRAGGRAETELVFLEGNGLPDRWGDGFTIAETGFGTGLNFLHTLTRFIETTPRDAHLHYISVENAPLSPEDLARVHTCWPELAEASAALRAHYPLPIAGWHRIHLPRVTLTLGFGDGTELLRSIDAQIDAWFLDGFSPAKNPDLWHEGLIAEIARLSAPGATIGSFTAAGDVRRALEAVGFTIERRDGFGHKRHRIAGVRAGQKLANEKPAQHVAIIGGGIAGASVARALAIRGIRVTLHERAAQLAVGASGNPAAVLYPQVTKEKGTATRWYFSAYAHALRLLTHTPGVRYASPGMLKLPKDAKEESRLREAHQNLGLHAEVMRYTDAGAWFPQGTWLDAPSWIAALVDHPLITVKCNSEVTALPDADAVVLACAHGCAAFAPSLAIGASAGQVSIVPARDVSHPLTHIVCHRGYIIPQAEAYLVGATFDHRDLSCEVTQANHYHNRAEANAAIPGWVQGEGQWQGRTSLRATTPDRLPYIGKLATNLYVTTGHGSRGMLSAPLGGEIIASMIAGEMVPLPRDILQAIDPLRQRRL